MATKTPRVLQATLISCSSTETNHHACGTTCLTESSRVIDSYLWGLSSTVEFDPREWSFLNTKAPNIIYCLLACVSSEYKKVWLWENNWMTISSSWSWSNDWNNHPLSLILTVSHIEKVEIITSKRASSSSSSIYYHLHLLNVGWGVSCSWWWWYSLNYFKKTEINVVYLPLSSVQAFKSMLNMKVSPVIEYFPVSPVAPPKRTTLYLFTMVMVWPNLAYGTFLAMSSVSWAWFGSLSLPFSPLAPVATPSFFFPSSADIAAS